MAKKKESQRDTVLETALARFERAQSGWDENWNRAKADIRFSAPGILEQWDHEVKKERESAEGKRPCLTLDKTNQYVKQVVNDIRQNRPSIKVRPVDDKGDPKVAEILQGIIRHIEDSSQADVATDTAAEHALRGGFGFMRVLTEYCDEDGFDQDIRIKRVRNQFSILVDPEYQEPDGSDIEFAFVFDDLPREEFKRKYPDAPETPWQENGNDGDWITRDKVRVAEYWSYETTQRTLVLIRPEAVELVGAEKAWRDELPKDFPDELIARKREVDVRKVICRKITGRDIIETKEWPGKFIPIVMVIGNEVDDDGKPVLSGAVNAIKDAQRMYNFNASSYVETVNLAFKAPYVAPVEGTEGFEEIWKFANVKNLAVLPYRSMTPEGQPIPPPQRQMPPPVPSGFVQGMTLNEHDIQAGLGMYSASLGAPSNEKSGKAILARQREGDVGNFHYIDNLSRSIRYLGRILLDLIPRIYDTRRIARIVGEDGTSEPVMLDPNAPQPVTKETDAFGRVVQEIYNPTLGKYDVRVTAGPSYTTQRQEAAEAMVTITQGNPDLMRIAGDLMFKAMDWPGADEIAERLKKLLPPQLQEQDENGQPNGQPNQQAQMMIQQMQQVIQKLQGELQTEKQNNQVEMFKAATDRMKLQIEKFDAITDRIEAMASAQAGIQQQIGQLSSAVLGRA